MADTTATGVAPKSPDDDDLPDLPKIDEQGSAMSIIRKVLPYLWPKDQAWVKYRVVAAFAMLFLAKIASVTTPFFYKGAVDALAPDDPGVGFLMITSAVGLTIAYGLVRLLSVGFNQLRDAVFARVGQRALRRLALETFQHMHALSLRYHITRKTGGLSRIIERGVKGVEFLLRFLLFSMGPLVLELLMIAGILWWVFDFWYLTVVVVTIGLYIWFTFAVTEWRVKIRRRMNERDTDANQKAIDSLLNYETVKYFSAETAYMVQITMPLNFLGSVYREIRHHTVAVVGPSGSRKSTIGRLLFRFYDVQNGALKIDGQDVRDISQTSLRSAIGVVPQDTVLFNDTIGYNVAYGKSGATQEEVETAAKAAQIHDFIASLPDGYNTVVGERGLKLSGGEKQRVGIARTLLKNPPILLLDEATSALDSDTERDIQESLKAMGKGRSVITIAHRLSTVVDADKIVVLVNGRVEEEGTHAELLSNDGRYASMWHRQAAEEDVA